MGPFGPNRHPAICNFERSIASPPAALPPLMPASKFGMPDVAGAVSWLTEIADQWPSIKAPPHVTTLTHHYYFGGPATNPEVNILNLLKPATMQKVQNTANIASAAASKMGARVRMTEGNTCYRGGKPGVSDVFAAAIWSADYSLLLASNDYSGVNLHGGTGKSVANSVGGTLPGDSLLEAKGETPEQIAAHPHPLLLYIMERGNSIRGYLVLQHFRRAAPSFSHMVFSPPLLVSDSLLRRMALSCQRAGGCQTAGVGCACPACARASY
jgi:hypothetical protein